MHEGCGHRTPGLDPALTAIAPVGKVDMAFEVGEAFGDSLLVGAPGSGGLLRRTQGVEERNGPGGPRTPGRSRPPGGPKRLGRPSSVPWRGEMPTSSACRSSGATCPASPRVAVSLHSQVAGDSGPVY